MTLLRTVADLRRELAPARQTRTIGLVPTMGALHEGHASLFRLARRSCGLVVASIFVNPRQFNDPADLAKYPRQEGLDAAMVEAEGVDVLFVPSSDEIYPHDHATSVAVRGAAVGFEGAFRPGHFDGVATICVALFSIVQPTVAFFGQKDAQQVAVIGQVVRDLHLPIELRTAPTVRDADGLALSSRNARLSADERARARAIPRALEAGLRAHLSGRDVVSAARAAMASAGLGALDVEYCEVAGFDGRPTLVIAVRAGATRLIDNVPLDEPHLAGFPHQEDHAARSR